LHPFNHHFNHETSLFDNWQSIALKNITYTYSQSQSKPPFAVGPIDLTLERGETVFLIGANGSGKSTLFMLLSGLYLPVSGGLWVDGEEVNSETRSSYRELFSSVFSDFYLFQHLLDGFGQDVENDLINEWLAHLQLSEKAKVENNRILNTQLSQGQRKRLALLIAVLEQRSILILDEWAADQDPYYRQIFYEQILPILKQKGYTVFAISHDDKYFQHADRIIQMDQGILKSMPL
jgi:putative ATP-binding cassette transporter